MEMLRRLLCLSVIFTSSCSVFDQFEDTYSQRFSANDVVKINELQSKETQEYISKMINKDLSNSYVRVEVICDREGFWLKPHCDIKEKLMSSIVFVNPYGESENLGTDFYNGGFTLIGDSYSALRAFLLDLYAGSRFILKEVYEFLKLPFGFFRLLFYVSSIIGLLLALTTVTSGIKPNTTSVPAVSAQSENTTKTEKVSGVKGKQLRTITITVFCTLVLVRLAKTPVFTNKIQVVTKVEADKVKDTDGE